jgi:formylglycine-generating enzyme required for sulfatase activity
MHGNVFEWCEDGWHDSYDGAPGDGSAWQAPGSGFRVLRGGCWSGPARWCRSAYRLRWPAGGRTVVVGIRPASSSPFGSHDFT